VRNQYFLGRTAWLALALGAAALSGCVFSPGHGGSGPRGTLEGTWVTAVSAGPGQAGPFLSIATYTPAGQVIEENNSPMIRTLGQGEWRRTGRDSFQRTITSFNFTGPTRVYNGATRVVSDITLGPGGDSYHQVSRFDIYDTAGQLIASGQNTGHARRCGIGSRIPACLGLEAKKNPLQGAGEVQN
jgi:hypothetical protein